MRRILRRVNGQKWCKTCNETQERGKCMLFTVEISVHQLNITFALFNLEIFQKE